MTGELNDKKSTDSVPDIKTLKRCKNTEPHRKSPKGIEQFYCRGKKMSTCQKIKNYKPLTKLKAKQNTRSRKLPLKWTKRRINCRNLQLVPQTTQQRRTREENGRAVRGSSVGTLTVALTARKMDRIFFFFFKI